jgi:hypothetical protein
MSTEEVELFGGPLDGQRRVVPTTLSAVSVRQVADFTPEDEAVPFLVHRYVRSEVAGRFDYCGGWVQR